jgi:molecular chaperone GrpE
MNQTKRSDGSETPERVGAAVEDAAKAPAAELDQAAGETQGQAEEAGAEPSPREAELEAELAATKERLLRALADAENLRRRTTREVEEAHKYAITGFARELLEVADNLSRALASIPVRARDEIGFVKNLAEGVAMTEKTLLASFERHQIAKVTPRPGDKFDHNRHQAMFEVETEEYAPGTIAQVMQPGYVIADRLLRPALVGVAKTPALKAAAADEAEAGSNGSDATGRHKIEVKPGKRLDTNA